MNIEIEAVFLDKILYIGEEIPEALMTDTNPKFILLGTPQEMIDKLTTIYQRGREEEREKSTKLWDLLDEIDMLPDTLHPNTLEAHERCWKGMVKTAHKRHAILTTDGYKLFEPNTTQNEHTSTTKHEGVGESSRTDSTERPQTLKALRSI